MAKASPFNATSPEFKAPEFKLPKFDVDALFALQTANLAAAHEVQSIVLEAVHAIAKVQHGWIQENVAGRRQDRRREGRGRRQAGLGSGRRRPAAGGRAGRQARPGEHRRVQGARRLTTARVPPAVACLPAHRRQNAPVHESARGLFLCSRH